MCGERLEAADRHARTRPTFCEKENIRPDLVLRFHSCDQFNCTTNKNRRKSIFRAYIQDNNEPQTQKAGSFLFEFWQDARQRRFLCVGKLRTWFLCFLRFGRTVQFDSFHTRIVMSWAWRMVLASQLIPGHISTWLLSHFPVKPPKLATHGRLPKPNPASAIRAKFNHLSSWKVTPRVEANKTGHTSWIMSLAPLPFSSSETQKFLCWVNFWRWSFSRFSRPWITNYHPSVILCTAISTWKIDTWHVLGILTQDFVESCPSLGVEIGKFRSVCCANPEAPGVPHSKRQIKNSVLTSLVATWNPTRFNIKYGIILRRQMQRCQDVPHCVCLSKVRGIGSDQYLGEYWADNHKWQQLSVTADHLFLPLALCLCMSLFNRYKFEDLSVCCNPDSSAHTQYAQVTSVATFCVDHVLLISPVKYEKQMSDYIQIYLQLFVCWAAACLVKMCVELKHRPWFRAPVPVLQLQKIRANQSDVKNFSHLERIASIRIGHLVAASTTNGLVSFFFVFRDFRHTWGCFVCKNWWLLVLGFQRSPRTLWRKDCFWTLRTTNEAKQPEDNGQWGQEKWLLSLEIASPPTRMLSIRQIYLWIFFPREEGAVPHCPSSAVLPHDLCRPWLTTGLHRCHFSEPDVVQVALWSRRVVNLRSLGLTNRTTTSTGFPWTPDKSRCWQNSFFSAQSQVWRPKQNNQSQIYPFQHAKAFSKLWSHCKILHVCRPNSFSYFLFPG